MKTHLSLPTRDIAAGVAFYKTLLASAPAKHYADYALFVSDSPGLELVLELDPAAQAPASEHYGIAADTSDEVEQAIARLEAAGYPVDVERGETCCYAVQTKVWAGDPDGRRIWPLNRYFAEGPRETDWLSKGVVKHHRTMATTLGRRLGTTDPHRMLRVPRRLASLHRSRPRRPTTPRSPHHVHSGASHPDPGDRLRAS